MGVDISSCDIGEITIVRQLSTWFPTLDDGDQQSEGKWTFNSHLVQDRGSKLSASTKSAIAAVSKEGISSCRTPQGRRMCEESKL
jgi:hypothetical protein